MRNLIHDPKIQLTTSENIDWEENGGSWKKSVSVFALKMALISFKKKYTFKT